MSKRTENLMKPSASGFQGKAMLAAVCLLLLVAPASLPTELTWHKWQSYTTWLSGFFLLGWIYYAQSSLYLIDPAVRVLSPGVAAGIGIGSLVGGWFVYDLLCKSPLGKNETLLALLGFLFVVAMSYFYAKMFSGRGALIHTGALMATFMSGNVFRIIVPNQHKVVGALLAGQEPDPAYGKEAKQRSVHNNYLTLPVVFLMISNHSPLTHTSAIIPMLVALLTFAGAIIRHFAGVSSSRAGHCMAKEPPISPGSRPTATKWVISSGARATSSR